MGKKPEIIYTDDEKAIASGEFQAYVESEGRIVQDKRPPCFCRAFFKTFKDKLCKRVENDEQNKKTNIQWIDYIDEIVLTYNNKDVHSATGQTPYKARDTDNEFKSRLNIAMKAKKQRLYPELSVGDKVKIKRKKATTEKERTSHFLKGEYTVESIDEKLNQTYYTLEGYNRPLLRHELLNI